MLTETPAGANRRRRPPGPDRRLGRGSRGSVRSELLAERVPASSDGVPRLDFALLGLGEDGHTASLFPRAPALEATGEVCVAVHDSPKPPPDRVTLTLDVLRAARSSAILAVGEGKAAPAAAALHGPSPDVPASLLVDGPLELILDDAAAREIPAQARA